ncbi:hypothetical protein KP77_28060 [Jeotgalibacillus alimentarius]|uniref:Ethanolamine utilization protein EutN n=1 Tax=Jeotgalibacillus alimentarius TaxID=135826 RepID=A0A0C2RY20_9BACL|nr:EutN/CcmL family microcompartment protein [Jeotgalibacillus alimentarius]KIL46679.1 hypothetical protein KP77_28060 [Jeotgalibacillus alimentarius]
MIMGKVVSSLVSTRKYDELQGYKLLVIELLYTEQPSYVVAADRIGAGRDEFVLLSSGEPVRHGLNHDVPIDMLVVGILDQKPELAPLDASSGPKRGKNE